MVFKESATKHRALFEEIAFEQIDSLYSTALRLMRNRQDADVLIQETFRQAFQLFHRFEPSANFKFWIFKILFNIYFSKFRKNSATAPAVQLSHLEQTIDKALRQNHLKHWLVAGKSQPIPIDDQIMCTLETMPEDFCIAVLLRDMENFSYPEIGELLHISSAEVGLRIYTGRKLLQKSLLDFVKQKITNDNQ